MWRAFRELRPHQCRATVIQSETSLSLSDNSAGDSSECRSSLALGRTFGGPGTLDSFCLSLHGCDQDLITQLCSRKHEMAFNGLSLASLSFFPGVKDILFILISTS